MKTECFFLALPFLATLGNVLFVVVWCLPHAKAQPDVQQAFAGIARGESCINADGSECHWSDLPPVDDYDHQELAELAIVDETTDPLLTKMPHDHFYAYRRVDVSSFYGEPQGSRTEATPKFRGQAAKFVNMSPSTVTLYWVGPKAKAYQNTLGPWESGGTSSHPGHEFVMTVEGSDDTLCSITIVPGQSTYYCDPFVDNDESQPGHALHHGPKLSLDELDQDDLADYEAYRANLAFAERYRNFTGYEWLSFYPRTPPQHPVWHAEYYGQTYQVTTNETHFLRMPERLPKVSIQEMRESDTEPYRLSDYRAPGALNLTIKALSCSPRIFEIQHFLSDAEVDHILDVVRQKNSLERSTTAGHLSETRTSRTTWIARHTDAVLNAIFRRAANVLRIDEELLRYRIDGERDEDLYADNRPINEDLQIVSYQEGQFYTPHHDFGYSTQLIHENAPSRSINLCMYLNDVPAGGETSFPRWRNGETGEALDVKPEKGKAVIFYMINPDGNVDDLTQHEAKPVLEGEKWFANLWIHDPVRL